jgi:hypothetical protein
MPLYTKELQAREAKTESETYSRYGDYTCKNQVDIGLSTGPPACSLATKFQASIPSPTSGT